MSRACVGLAALLIALGAGGAGADAIQQWKTPEGGIYFGDRPPPGSTLVQTIADTPDAAAPAEAGAASDLERAAAEGRDIIRHRQADRAAERQLEAEREARLDELAAGQAAAEGSLPFLIVDTFPPCRAGDRCFEPRRRPHQPHDSWDRPPRPPTGGGWSAMVQAPVRPPLSRGGVLFGGARREGSARRHGPAGR